MSNTKYHSTNRDNFEALIEGFNCPFTAKDISEADSTNMSTTTIYRLLEEYENNGLLRKNLGEDGSAIYYYLKPCTDKNHFLLECEKCHKISHIDCTHLHHFAKHISKKHDFEISNYQLIIKGVCKQCKTAH